ALRIKYFENSIRAKLGQIDGILDEIKIIHYVPLFDLAIVETTKELSSSFLKDFGFSCMLDYELELGKSQSEAIASAPNSDQIPSNLIAIEAPNAWEKTGAKGQQALVALIDGYIAKPLVAGTATANHAFSISTLIGHGSRTAVAPDARCYFV